MSGEQAQVTLCWWLLGIGAVMCFTGAGDLGEFFMVLGLVIMVPYFVVHGILMEPQDGKGKK